jgi:hypothetical protein
VSYETGFPEGIRTQNREKETIGKATRRDWIRFHNVVVGVRQKIHEMRDARRRQGDISSEPIPDLSLKEELAPRVEIEDLSEEVEPPNG